MNWLAQFASFLFPLRTHLIDEIEYLRGQVAQRQRQVDVLTDALVMAKIPVPKVQFERESSGKLIPVQPRGWDAWRAARRSEEAKAFEDARANPMFVSEEQANGAS